MTTRTDYRVQGLDCAEETAVLTREVGRRAGVLNLEFDVIQGRMAVLYEPGTISSEAIIAAVNATGMTASVWSAAPAEAASFWRRHGRDVLALASGVLLMAAFAMNWALQGSLWGALADGHHPGRQLAPTPTLLLLLSAVAGTWFFIPKAIGAVRRLQPDMNLLMTLAVAGAVFLGDWFEAATVAFLFAVALLLEHWSVGRARRAIEALMDLSPTVAHVRDAATGHWAPVRVDHVPTGAAVLVRPGEKVPLDGLVVRGNSHVNQAPITGESMPVEKNPGDDVFAGTINHDGSLELKVTRTAGDTTLAHIIHLVQEAQGRRAPAQQWVDAFSRYYTPVMLLLAAGVAAVPPALGIGGWADWLYRGLVLLVIACPCALVISTPVSVVSALTRAARSGVLIKGGMYLEAAGKIAALAMDKTGTLTRGQPLVQTLVAYEGHTERDLLEIAAALETNSQHPLAKAIVAKAHGMGIRPAKAEGFRRIGGKGAQGVIDGRTFWIGSHRFQHEMGEDTPAVHQQAQNLEDAGHSVVLIGDGEHVCGIISLADSMRPGVREVLDDLRRLGVRKILMLTGDNEGTARAIAVQAGVDEFHAEMLPADKVRVITDTSREYGSVAMIGDGVNDAPAMAAATFGIAMAAMGADAAIETADVALMSDDLALVPWLIRHSRRTLRIIQANIAFALAVKAMFIALSLAGMASLWMAIAADTGASLLVIFNGLRLLGNAKWTMDS